MADIKVFEKWVKCQDQGHMLKIYGSIGKALS